MSLVGKVAIVTGASQGIGQAIAERLGRDGANVVVGHLDNSQKAGAVVRSIEAVGGQAIAVAVDVRRIDAIQRLFDEAFARWGHVDVVVANAGVNMNRPVLETTEDDFERMFSVNTRGTFFVFREAANRVRDGGSIIGVSSNMTLQPRPGVALYAGSKAAVEQFVKVLARELGPRKINVNAVAPGPTNTTMVSKLSRETAPAATPLGRLGEPREIAAVVAFLASADGRWVNGQIIGVNGGLV